MLASTNILVCTHVMPGLRKGRRAGVQAIPLGQRSEEQTEPFFYSGV